MKKLVERYTNPDVLRQFLRREADPDIQFLKYAIAGAVATAVHIVIFHILAWKTFPALQPEDPFVRMLNLSIETLENAMRSRNSMLSNAGAFVVSNLVCWIINRLWVFTPGRHHVLIEVSLFYAASGVAIGIGTVLMGWMIDQYGLLTTTAFGANLVTSALINYAMRKFVIFKG